MSKDRHKMRLVTYEEFVATNHKIHYIERFEELRKKYPFHVMVEGYSPELDFATRWCWQNFGPYVGPCGDHYSEYPACPLVLAIEEYKVRRTYKDREGVEKEYWEPSRDPGKHSHEGTWDLFSLGKTGYDEFFMEYYFSNEEDAKKFRDLAPTFGLGENYED